MKILASFMGCFLASVNGRGLIQLKKQNHNENNEAWKITNVTPIKVKTY